MGSRDWARVGLVAIFALIVIIASAGTGFAAGWYLSPNTGHSPASPDQASIQNQFRVFWEAWDIVERNFNREEPLDTQSMVYGAARGMVASLGDPYTMFIEPAQASVLSQDLEGKFEGIGATVDMVDGHLVIVEPLQGSPALAAGLLPGDVVLEVNGQTLEGMDLMKAITLIRGPEGSQVHLLIRRESVAEPFTITVTRAEIQLPTVSHRMLDNDIAYIQLTEFNSQATVRLRDALRELLAGDPQALIFDLRGNPGGYLHIAVEVASQFISDGIVVSERDGSGRATEYRASGDGMAYDIPLYVLIDEGSASASEIVAGAIQDAGRGVLIGRSTFGKGSVQTTHTLSDGSAVRVTIARWFTPKGHQIDKVGLTPDVLVPPDPEATPDDDVILERAVEHILEAH